MTMRTITAGMVTARRRGAGGSRWYGHLGSVWATRWPAPARTGAARKSIAGGVGSALELRTG